MARRPAIQSESPTLAIPDRKVPAPSPGAPAGDPDPGPVPGLSIRQLTCDPRTLKFNMPITPVVDMRRNWGLAEMKRDAEASRYGQVTALYIAQALAEGKLHWVLFRDGKPIGCCSVHNFQEGRRTVDLDGVFIRKDMRRAGIGSWFVSRVIREYTAGTPVAGVHLRCSGPWLPQFYSRIGFTAKDTVMVWTPPELRGVK